MTRACPLLLLVSLATASFAQERVVGIEFLSERLRIPESEKFDEGAYIESGVGLSFGIDKRLTYLPGQYEEAAQQFELSVSQFANKAEVWVYLARAYFYMKAPDTARGTLERAQAQMPDLAASLWQPLIASLEREIRQHAQHSQARMDFYSTGPDEALKLFRLYLFLKDGDNAGDLVTVCHDRARMMREGAIMLSGSGRSSRVKQAEGWDQLGESLANELAAAGLVPDIEKSVPIPEPVQVPDINEAERIRVLQLRVDFYSAQEEDFLQLFQAYLYQADSSKARGVVGAISRHMADLKVRASVAPTVSDQVAIEEQIEAFQMMRNNMAGQVPAPPAEKKP